MGSVGNYLGAAMGGEYDDSWVTNTNFPDRQNLLGSDGKLKDLSAPTPGADNDPNKPKFDSRLLGPVPGLLSDRSFKQELDKYVHGPQAVNWESKTFAALRKESEALSPTRMTGYATAWKDAGTTLKTQSETFKSKVEESVSGHWSGESASAADSAVKNVTKTSIYDFTPSSEAIHNRLTVLSTAFQYVQDQFKLLDPNDKLIEDGNFDKAKLDEKISDFNSKYVLDGDGRLRNRSNGYVPAQQAIDEMDEIDRSIKDYARAVQLFRDTYQDAAMKVVEDFPNLPSPPNMTFGQNLGGPGGNGGGGGGGGGGGNPLSNKSGTPVDTKKYTDALKNLQNKNTTNPNANNSSTNPAQALSGITSGLSDAAKQAASAGQQALSGATDALNQALGGLSQNGLGTNPAIPEGALALNNGKAVGGIKPAGGAGGGSAVKGVSAEKALRSGTGSTVSNAGKASTAAVQASRAGVAGQGTAGGMGGGAPAAGNRGGSDKEHKVNKALRTKQNGEELLGEAEAIVPVVGEKRLT
ncbi:hypothetical protein [Mycobacterium sp. NPDC050853]|uniref:hypothetical protein n=1 Tax=Mycobacterium sp. NPDC050853 TaxID=3155160 RepID=UPI0033F5CEE1